MDTTQIMGGTPTSITVANVLISAQQTQEIIMGSSFKSMADMFDGGGAGMVGDTFKGGPLSGLLNEIGVRPYGFAARALAENPEGIAAAMADKTGAMRNGLLSSSLRPQARPTEPNYTDRMAPQRAPLGEMEALDEGSMGTDASGTPSFRDRMQTFAENNAGDPQISQPEIGGGGITPAGQFRPIQPNLPSNAQITSFGPAQADAQMAPGGRTDIGTRFLYEAQRAGVAPSMDLFQKFMQTGSIR